MKLVINKQYKLNLTNKNIYLLVQISILRKKYSRYFIEIHSDDRQQTKNLTKLRRALKALS